MSLEITHTTSNDIAALAHIHLASKKMAEKGIVDQAYLDAMTDEEYVQKWQSWYAADDSKTLAAKQGGNVTGFVSYGPLRTPPPGTSKIRPLYSSEIFAIYVLPQFFKGGIGTVLLKAATEDLKDQKHQSLCLWALAKNKRACDFYTKMGGQRVGKKMVEMGGKQVKESCFGWRDIKEILEK